MQKNKYEEHQRLIDSWTARINDWSDPAKFDDLLAEYNRTIVPLSQDLELNQRMSAYMKRATIAQVRKLTDMMDKTIKSLKGSPLYANDQQLQVSRFAALLNPYYMLMRKWMNAIPSSQYDAWCSKIVEGEYNRKSNMMYKIDLVYTNLSSKTNSSQLQPSGCLSVEGVKVGSNCSFSRQFNEKSSSFTLEDMFSLMHQNILSSTLVVEKENGIQNASVPEELQPLVDQFKSLQGVQLFGVTHEYPVTTVEYNYPLQNHSIRFQLDYNARTKSYSLQWKFFGNNGSRWGYRMDAIQARSYIDGLLFGANFPFQPKHDESKKEVISIWSFDAKAIEYLPDLMRDVTDKYKNIMNNGPGQDESRQYKESLNYFSELPADVRAKCIDAMSPETSRELSNILNNKLRSDLNSYLRKCPELYFVVMQQAQSIDKDMLEQALKNAVPKQFLEKLITQFGLGYTISNGWGSSFTLFDKMFELYSSAEVSAFLQNHKPNLSSQKNVLSQLLSKPNPDVNLIMQMVELGAPLTAITDRIALNGLLTTNVPALMLILVQQLSLMNANQFTQWVIEAIPSLSIQAFDKMLGVIAQFKSKLDWDFSLAEEICNALTIARKSTKELVELMGNQKISFKGHRSLFAYAIAAPDLELAKHLLQFGEDFDEHNTEFLLDTTNANADADAVLLAYLQKLSVTKLTKILKFNIEHQRIALSMAIVKQLVDKIDFTDGDFLLTMFRKYSSADLISLLEKRKPDLTHSGAGLYTVAIKSHNYPDNIKLIELLHSMGLDTYMADEATKELLNAHLNSQHDAYLTLLENIFLPKNRGAYNGFVYDIFRLGSVSNQDKFLKLIQKTMSYLDLNYSGLGGTSLLERIFKSVVDAGHEANYTAKIVGADAVDASKMPKLFAQALKDSKYGFARYLLTNAKNIDAFIDISFNALGNDAAEGRELIIKLLKKLSPKRLSEVLEQDLNRGPQPSVFDLEMYARFAESLDLSNSSLLQKLLASDQREKVIAALEKKKPDLSNCDEDLMTHVLRESNPDLKLVSLITSLGAPIDYKAFTVLFSKFGNDAAGREIFSKLLDELKPQQLKLVFSYALLGSNTPSASCTMELATRYIDSLDLSNPTLLEHLLASDLREKLMAALEKNKPNLSNCLELANHVLESANPDPKLVLLLTSLGAPINNRCFSPLFKLCADTNNADLINLLKTFMTQMGADSLCHCINEMATGTSDAHMEKFVALLLDYLTTAKPDLSDSNNYWGIWIFLDLLVNHNIPNNMGADLIKAALACKSDFSKARIESLTASMLVPEIEAVFTNYFAENSIQNGWSILLYNALMDYHTVSSSETIDNFEKVIDKYRSQLQFEYVSIGSYTLLDAIVTFANDHKMPNIIALLPQQIDFALHKELLCNANIYKDTALLKAVIERSINFDNTVMLPSNALLFSAPYKEVLEILKAKLPDRNWDEDAKAFANLQPTTTISPNKLSLSQRMGAGETLDDLKEFLLRKYQSLGLRKEHLDSFNIAYTEGWHRGAWIACADKLLGENHLTPQEAVNEMNGLEFWQVWALGECYKNGLRNEHVKNLHAEPGGKLGWVHRDMLVWLINDKKCDPAAAVYVVIGYKSSDLFDAKEKLYKQYQDYMSGAGITANDLLARLATDGWQKTEAEFFKVGMKGVYTANDLVKFAKYCWGVTAYIIDKRPDLKKDFTPQHIVDMVGAGPMGLHALASIYKLDGSVSYTLRLTAQQFGQLKKNLTTAKDNAKFGETLLKFVVVDYTVSANPSTLFGGSIDTGEADTKRAKTSMSP